MVRFSSYGTHRAKFLHQVTLPNISANKRDPRKEWLYESGIKQWDAGDCFAPSSGNTRIYSFGYEEDFVMFTLRWGTPENPNLE